MESMPLCDRLTRFGSVEQNLHDNQNAFVVLAEVRLMEPALRLVRRLRVDRRRTLAVK